MNGSAGKDAIRRKYDGIAACYSSRYADADAIARRQVALVHRWGHRMEPGSTVLEIGCADGLVTEALVAAGFVVTAVDLSPAMIDAAGRRLSRRGLSAELRVADVEDLAIDHPFDVVLAVMWNFYAYVKDVEPVLSRLAGCARVKLLIDASPRLVAPPKATAAVRRAGFADVRWRPMLVPQRFRLPRGAGRLLAT
ncbi:MAG: class I SAM-dependent methyltransferase, partial [Bacillota bacterium]